MSLVSDTRNKDYIEKMHKAIKKCTENNIIVICASGNSGDLRTYYPACFPECITVGAVDINKKIAYFSTKNPEVDVCQVGVDVWGANVGGGYVKMSGTSMATPIVTGIAALIACKYKILFGKKITRSILYESLKLNTIDVGIEGVDIATGAGLCTLNQNYNDIKIFIDSDKYLVNGKVKTMDSSPVIDDNNRTLVPIRFLAEAQNKYVEWNNDERSVTILG